MRYLSFVVMFICSFLLTIESLGIQSGLGKNPATESNMHNEFKESRELNIEENSYLQKEDTTKPKREGFLKKLFSKKSDKKKAETSSVDTATVNFIKKLFAEEAKTKKQEGNIDTTRTKFKFYGWHPYWSKVPDSGYKYKSISTLSYFGVEAKTTDKDNIKFDTHGTGRQIALELFDQATNFGCNIDLTFKCQEKDVLNSILNDYKIQGSCISFLVDQLKLNPKIDGLCVMLENIPSGNSSSLTKFIYSLYSALRNIDKTLTLVLPPTDTQNNYNISELSQSVDGFILMGYNYSHSGNQPEAVAPLEAAKQKFSLKNAVAYYKSQGIPFSKFIVALPYFGVVWKKDQNKPASYSLFDYWTYAEIMINQTETDPDISFDNSSNTLYYDFEMDDEQYRCYYDNEQTLKTKYQWILDQKISGIGLWALGYGEYSKSFWEMLASNFEIEKPKSSIEKQPVKEPKEEKKTDSIIPSNEEVPVPDSLNGAESDTTSSSANTGEGQALEIDEGMIKKIIEKLETIFGKLFKNQIIVATIVITILVFGLLGLVGSLLFNSVRQLLYIDGLPKYILVNLGFFILAFLFFRFLHFIKPDILELFPGYYPTLRKIAWLAFIFCWLIINLLSYKLIDYIPFRHDKP